MLIDRRSFHRSRVIATPSPTSRRPTCERACWIWPLAKPSRAEPSCAAVNVLASLTLPDLGMNLAAGPPAESGGVGLSPDFCLGREKVSAERQTEKHDAGTSCAVKLKVLEFSEWTRRSGLSCENLSRLSTVLNHSCGPTWH